MRPLWMKSLMAVCLCGCLSFMLRAQDVASLVWTGNVSTDYAEGGNWSGFLVPTANDNASVNGGAEVILNSAATFAVTGLYLGNLVDETAPLTFTIANGELNIAKFYVGNAAGGTSEIIQTGGTLNMTAGGDPSFALGAVADATAIYRLQGGCLNLGGGNINIGRSGRGEFYQTGGAVTNGAWFAMGRLEGSTCLYDLSGGIWYHTQSGNGGFIVGEYAEEATLTVRGNGVLDNMGRLSINGNGTVNLEAGGVIKTSYISRQNTYGENSTVNFNGGTLAMTGPTAVRDNFIAPEIAHLYVKDGGANIEIGEGYVATINPPLEAAPGATDGGLVKSGTGSLILKGNATYLGPTRVAAGTLVLANEQTLPSLAPGDFTFASGTAIGIDPLTFSAGATADLLSRISLQANTGFALYTGTGDVTFDTAINLNGTGGFSKYGPNTATLTAQNIYSGETRLYAGTLKAEKGVGIPDTSHIVMAGGTWAPVNETSMTRALGTSADDLSLTGGNPLALSAIGQPMTVNIGGTGNELTMGDGGIGSGTLRLNDTGADNPLTFVNPLSLPNINATLAINSPDAGADVYMTGNIANTGGGHLYKTGNGTLHLRGSLELTSSWLVAEGGKTYLDAETTYKMHDIRVANNAELHLCDKANVEMTAWLYSGISGTGSKFYVEPGSRLSAPVGRFVAGFNNGSSGTYYISGGETLVGQLFIGNLGTGEVIQTGGSVVDGPGRNEDAAIGEYDNDKNVTGHGIYRISDGWLSVSNNFQIARYGLGEFYQSGGLVDSSMWMCVGRFGGATGLYEMTGGTLVSTGGGIIIGEEGVGTFNASGDGTLVSAVNAFRVGLGMNGKGSVTVTDGARIEAGAFNFGNSINHPSIYVDGATLAAQGSGRTLGSFINFANGAFAIGPNGLTLDSGDNTILFETIALAGGKSGGTITKTGSGMMITGQLPAVDTFVLEEGAISINPGTGGLVHRWSFNGNPADSAGAGVAGLIGNGITYTADNTAITLPGGDRNSAYIDLGDNILPSNDSPITIEIWSTLHSHANWQKMFSFGSGQANGILFTFTTGDGSQETSINPLSTGSANLKGTGKVDLNVPYYYAIVIEPDGIGGSTITAFRKDVNTGDTLGSYTGAFPNWAPSKITQTDCWLGNTWWDDPHPNADYDEVRIWNRSFTEAELRANVLLGPDKLPVISSEVEYDTPEEGNIFPEDPSEKLLDSNYLAHRWTFNGNVFDSIGGLPSQALGAVTFDHTAVTTAGGNKGTSAIQLGENVLPTEGPVTIELWARQDVARGWSQAIAIGSSIQDYLILGWVCNDSKAVNYQQGFICVNQTGNHSGTLGEFTAGTEYHFALVIVPDGNGGSTVTAYKQDAATGETLGFVTVEYPTWTPANITQSHCMLGRSEFNDPDASATYNELRIWNAALSEAQLTKNAQIGPDTLPIFSSTYVDDTASTLVLAAGTELDLNRNAITLNRVAGEGAIMNGTVTVTGSISPAGDEDAGTLTFEADTVVNGIIRLNPGDLLACSKKLDLTQATVIVNDVSNIGGAWTFATSDSGGIIGPVKIDNLNGSGYSISISGDRAVIAPSGTFMIIR
ncbi:MAG: autotransporter-associated beta strand repeat-containing protein [Kiritimatiellae bacterium]|nr:autotransporter-associated beta strand repeat-containing protein [Kiritimatiellia bacterium]